MDSGADRRHLDRRAEGAEQAVIAAAASDWSRGVTAFGFDLEHEAGIIFEAPAELGLEARGLKIDAAFLEEIEAAGEPLERRVRSMPAPLAIMATRSTPSRGGAATAR